MKFNYNFEDQTSITTFGDLKAALKERFDELFSKGYLYKGDMGETPQIVNRPLAKFNDNGEFEDWTALGRSIIEAIFKDTKYYQVVGHTMDNKIKLLNDTENIFIIDVLAYTKESLIIDINELGKIRFEINKK